MKENLRKELSQVGNQGKPCNLVMGKYFQILFYQMLILVINWCLPTVLNQFFLFFFQFQLFQFGYDIND